MHADRVRSWTFIVKIGGRRKLERKARVHLHGPRAADAQNPAEGRARDIRLRIPERHVIERAERVGANLQLIALHHGERPGQAEIRPPGSGPDGAVLAEAPRPDRNPSRPR